MTWLEMKFQLKGHRTTLLKIFREPPPTADLHWTRIEKLLDACKVTKKGTEDNGLYLSHKGKYLDVQQVPEDGIPTGPTIAEVRSFLKGIGVKPGNIDNFLRAV